ncbi:DUF6893 family small protein [Planosporangium mesophilum]
MTWWLWLIAVVVVIVAAFLIVSLPDINRYLRIRRM